MSEEARSTQFRQFAKLLWKDLLEANGQLDMDGYIDMNNDDDPTKYLEIIAERAYDLVCHALDASGYGAESVGDVPDMTAWPLRKEK